MSGPFNPRAIDPQHPQLFYMPESMMALADAWLIIGDAPKTRLPVHSKARCQFSAPAYCFHGVQGTRQSMQVLSLHAVVLRELFVGQQEGGGQNQAAVEIPLADCSLWEACCFLRLLYCPQDATRENLKALDSLLPAVASLAHKLDAATLLAQIVNHLKGVLHSRTISRLVDYTHLAEKLQQDELRLTCLRCIARKLAAVPPKVFCRSANSFGSPALAALADAGMLAGLGEANTLVVLGAVVAAGRELVSNTHGRYGSLQSCLPTVSELVAPAQGPCAAAGNKRRRGSFSSSSSDDEDESSSEESSSEEESSPEEESSSEEESSDDD